ncbi:MAG: RNA polymerase sigma factor [Planctomycetota bacterium]
MSDAGPAEQWVEGARAGDRVALAKLLTTLHPQLRARAAARMSAALRARSSPEDILQEVYLEVAHGVRGFEPRGRGAFAAWVQTILDHKLIDAHRALFRQARDVGRELPLDAAPGSSFELLLDVVYSESGTPSRVVRRQEALAALLACLPELSEDQQQAIRGRFLEGRSVREVAARLNKTEDAVVALCQRGLASLRVAMDRRGEFTHGG